MTPNRSTVHLNSCRNTNSRNYGMMRLRKSFVIGDVRLTGSETHTHSALKGLRWHNSVRALHEVRYSKGRWFVCTKAHLFVWFYTFVLCWSVQTVLLLLSAAREPTFIWWHQTNSTGHRVCFANFHAHEWGNEKLLFPVCINGWDLVHKEEKVWTPKRTQPVTPAHEQILFKKCSRATNQPKQHLETVSCNKFYMSWSTWSTCMWTTIKRHASRKCWNNSETSHFTQRDRSYIHELPDVNTHVKLWSQPVFVLFGPDSH